MAFSALLSARFMTPRSLTSTWIAKRWTLRSSAACPSGPTSDDPINEAMVKPVANRSMVSLLCARSGRLYRFSRKHPARLDQLLLRVHEQHLAGAGVRGPLQYPEDRGRGARKRLG